MLRDKVFCPNCGKEIRGKFCGSCGSRIDPRRLVKKGRPVYHKGKHVGTVQQKEKNAFIVETKDSQLLNLEFDQIDYVTDRIFLKTNVDVEWERKPPKREPELVLEPVKSELSLKPVKSELSLKPVKSEPVDEIGESVLDQSEIKQVKTNEILHIKEPVRPSSEFIKSVVIEDQIEDEQSNETLQQLQKKKEIPLSEKHKAAFEAIRYNFSEIDFLKESQVITKPYFGSLKHIIWDFGAIPGKLLFEGEGKLSISKDTKIKLRTDGTRKIFDWLNPWEGIETNTTPETTNEALQRERGIPERLIKVGGEVSIEIETSPDFKVQIVVINDPKKIGDIWNLVKDLVYFVDLQ
ncbi:MAG: zinc ribbon domain-containing protein [Promethearchaeota archaeon]